MTDNQIPIPTDRLLLDRFQKEDWRDFYRIELSLEQHLFTAESYKPSTEELTKNYVYELSDVNYGEQENGFILAIRVKKSLRLVGFAGFQNGTLKANGQAEERRMERRAWICLAQGRVHCAIADGSR